jgi:hypothetical protein
MKILHNSKLETLEQLQELRFRVEGKEMTVMKTYRTAIVRHWNNCNN